MRTSNSVKVMALVLLAIGTSRMTSVILAQIPSPTRGKAEVQKRPGKQGLTAPRADEKAGAALPRGSTTAVGAVAADGLNPPVEPFGLTDESQLARCKLEHLNVAQVGRRVDVSMSLIMVDRRPGWSYFWGLKLYGPRIKDGPLSMHRYVEQRFVNQPGVVLNPAFTESLTLEPGTYKIKIIFYRVPPGFDVRRLDNHPATDDGFGAVASVRTVTIP